MASHSSTAAFPVGAGLNTGPKNPGPLPPSSTMSGTPTGVPAGQSLKVAWVYDTTNNKIWVYNAAWRSTTLA